MLSSNMPPGESPVGPRLLVSIHDVTPAFEDSVRQLWLLCRSHGFTPALLVVPNWHGQWPVADYPHFVQWLRECASEPADGAESAHGASGAEIILHGERHDEVGLPRTAVDTLRALGRTNREGEFLTLNSAQAVTRIAGGLTLLRSLSMNPGGFIPPAWLAREDTHNAVRAAGLGFSEDATGVRLHRSNRRLKAPAIRWSARTRWRASTSAMVVQLARSIHRHRPLIRIALHPQDLDQPVAAASVEREIAYWSRHGEQVRYDAL